MKETASDFNRRLAELLKKLAQSASKLGERCRNDAAFASRVEQMIEALGNFYDHLGGDAPQVFESKVRKWVKTPGDDYMGFVGELFVAERLMNHSIQHRFIPETTAHPTPDIESMVGSRNIYFEIKTISEDTFSLFAAKVKKQIQQIEHFPVDCGIRIISGKIDRGKEESLTASAIQAIRYALTTQDYSPFRYEGTEGTYIIEFLPGAVLDPRWPKVQFLRPPWVESRIDKGEGIPFLEAKLKRDLRDNIKQFTVHRPTFFVWFNFDESLLDFGRHVSNVLSELGQTEFALVAGIIVDDPFAGWMLFENQSPKYAELKSAGLFNTIRALQHSNK